MILSCCTWALSGSDDDVVARLADAGFRWIDVRPYGFTTEAVCARVRALGLRVSCVAASFGLPDGAALDSPEADAIAQALTHTGQVLTYGAGLGATAAYLVPGKDGSQEALDRYARSLIAVADRASALGITLCVEHFPGSALPTAAATLDFLRTIGHPGLSLLLDIGHAQMSGEDPAAIITDAGPRLGYVHLDDNDGRNDLHVALTDGVLTVETLRRTFAALDGIGYAGAVSLELSPALPDPLDALKRSRDILRTLASLA